MGRDAGSFGRLVCGVLSGLLNRRSGGLGIATDAGNRIAGGHRQGSGGSEENKDLTHAENPFLQILTAKMLRRGVGSADRQNP